MLEKIYIKVPQSEVCRGANCWRGKQWRGTSPGSGRSGGEQTPGNFFFKKKKKVENHCEMENLRASGPPDTISKILKHLKKTNMQNLIILILTSEDNKEPQGYANILEVPLQFEKRYFTELIKHCDSTELCTLCVILKRTYLSTVFSSYRMHYLKLLLRRAWPGIQWCDTPRSPSRAGRCDCTPPGI